MIYYYCMSVLDNVKYILYTSSNTQVFTFNFYAWFFIKLTLAVYYGFNVNYAIGGYIFWSFWEYTYHRIIMHGLKNTVYYNKLHGYHHLHPSKIAHIPVFQYILVSPVFYVSSYYINPSYVFSYAVGHLCGLYCFEMMHYVIHNNATKDQIYIKYHLYHHKYSNLAYCFTTPCFDILCGTFPDKFTYNLLGILPIPYFSFLGIKEKLA
jgi:hypothetical protein